MLEDNVKSSQVKEKEKEKKNDLISLSESESFNSIKVSQVKKTERNKYICPEEGCDLIPRIINVHSEIGTIVMQCPNNHINDIDVEEYLEKIDKKMKQNIEPKERVKILESYDYDSSDKGGTLISNNENNKTNESEDAKIIEEKNKDISNIIRAYNRLLLTQENQPDNYLHNQNLINLGNFILSENSRFFDDKTNLKNSIKKSIPNNQNIIDNNYENEFDNLINKLKEDEKQEETALKNLETEYNIYLKEHCQDPNLCLKLKGPKDDVKYKKLGDKGFKYISQIRFKNLIEINLANNKIKDITYLNNMLLPHLEVLDLSDNEIIDIQPVANLLSKNLNEISLQYNQIKNIKPFLEPKFSVDSLEIMRIDNNKFDTNYIKSKDFQKFIEKYKKKIIYEKKDWKSLNEKYKCDINNETPKLDLGSRKDNDIIIDLYASVVYGNKIKILILDNNRIQDASLIAKMPLYKLEYLDLSLNIISSIIFLKKLSVKSKDLKVLFLHDNKINDITPLYDYNNGEEEKENKEEKKQSGTTIFKQLEILTLRNNSLNLKERVTYDILVSLIENEDSLTFDYNKDDLTILPSKKDDSNKEHTGEARAALEQQIGYPGV